MPTFADDISAVRAIEGRLKTLFASNGTYGQKYAPFGGVDVRFIYDESDIPDQVGRPMVLLEDIQGGDSVISAAKDDFRGVSVIATIHVTDFTGAQIGTANPTASDELLGKDINREFKNNYATWRDLGLLGITIQTGSMVASLDADQMPVRKTPHTITFDYERS